MIIDFPPLWICIADMLVGAMFGYFVIKYIKSVRAYMKSDDISPFGDK